MLVAVNRPSPTLLAVLLTAGCAPIAPVLPEPPAAVMVPFDSPAAAVDLDPDPSVLHVALEAGPVAIGLEGGAGFAYNGQIPGPTLRAQVGDTLVVDLTNGLIVPTSVHWHGVHVPFAMDGAGWMTEPLAPGASTVITFPLTQAGTFWYHPHFNTERQVDLGLYGVLVVEDPAEPPLPDLVLVFDDAHETDPFDDSSGHGDDDEGSHGHRTALPDAWLVNGAMDPFVTLPAGERLRGRLLNASNVAYLALSWPGMRVIGGDQGLLSAPQSPEVLVLAPGDRAEVEWLGGSDVEILALPWSLHGGAAAGDARRLLTVQSEGVEVSPAPLEFSGRPRSADPGTTDVRYVLQGDGDHWMINGERFPDVTIAELPLGADAMIELRNVSPTSHPFHLHGHSFEVLSDQDGPSTGRRVEDTVDVRIREVVRLRLIADNPGDWMAHCHLLPHADDGMMTVLRVGSTGEDDDDHDDEDDDDEDDDDDDDD